MFGLNSALTSAIRHSSRSACWTATRARSVPMASLVILHPNLGVSRPHRWDIHRFTLLKHPYSTEPPPTVPPHVWIEALESTATAPWLASEHTEQDKSTPESRMGRAFSRIFQIYMYLARPQEDVPAYLVEFEKSPAEPEAEMTRARNAIVVLIRAVVRDISSIPQNSPLRSKHSETFDVFNALEPLHDLYIADAGSAPEVPEWTEFWERASPILVFLGNKLEEGGFGIKNEK